LERELAEAAGQAFDRLAPSVGDYGIRAAE
jgi:hypothetical protein